MPASIGQRRSVRWENGVAGGVNFAAKAPNEYAAVGQAEDGKQKATALESFFLRRRNHVLSNHVLRHHNHVATCSEAPQKKILRALQLLRIWMVEQGSENAATTDAMTAATSAVAREAGCIARGPARARARASPDHGAKDKNALC